MSKIEPLAHAYSLVAEPVSVLCPQSCSAITPLTLVSVNSGLRVFDALPVRKDELILAGILTVTLTVLPA